MTRRARIACGAALALWWTGLAACGGAEVPLSRVTLSLPLTFDAQTLLEVFVFRAADASCDDLAQDNVDVEALNVADRRLAASRLNETGAAIEVEFEELPAEQPLVFFARAMRASPRAVLAHACQSDVRIESGGQVAIELRLVEPTAP